MAKEFGSLILPDFAWAHWLRVGARLEWRRRGTTGHECAIRAARLTFTSISSKVSNARGARSVAD